MRLWCLNVSDSGETLGKVLTRCFLYIPTRNFCVIPILRNLEGNMSLHYSRTHFTFVGENFKEEDHHRMSGRYYMIIIIIIHGVLSTHSFIHSDIHKHTFGTKVEMNDVVVKTQEYLLL